MNADKVRSALGNGRKLMLTHTDAGDLFGLDTGQAVAAKAARSLQGDLFVKPAEDGLFPGFSQTWTINE